MKKKNGRRKIIMGITSFLIATLFYHFVWNGVIVNPTAMTALEEEDGKQVVLQKVDKNRSFGIKELQDGYFVYGLYDGFWGWTVTDKVYLSKAINDKKVSFINDSLAYKNNKDLDVVLISSLDNRVSYFKAFDENEKEVILDTNREDIDLHFGYTKGSLFGDITIEAYSQNNNLIFSE